jgi:predicted Fe-Mo cluster-binding NifX family protein
MTQKVLVPIYGNEVAPRFDLATEVWLARVSPDGSIEEERTVVLPQASAESLCHLIITESVKTVICGGIEEEYYEYLRWKKVNVVDSVIGLHQQALEAFKSGTLEPGTILFHGEDEV